MTSDADKLTCLRKAYPQAPDLPHEAKRGFCTYGDPNQEVDVVFF